MNYLKNFLSNYKFDPSKLKLGMRTLKTGLVAFLALLIFRLFGWEGLRIGTLATVFDLCEGLDKSVHFDFSYVVRNSAGGLLSLLFFFINQFSHNQFWITLVSVPIFTMLGIMINVSINNKARIIGGTSAPSIITLSIPVGDTTLYIFTRVFKTFCRVSAAILVDSDVDKIRGLLRKKS